MKADNRIRVPQPRSARKKNYKNSRYGHLTMSPNCQSRTFLDVMRSRYQGWKQHQNNRNANIYRKAAEKLCQGDQNVTEIQVRTDNISDLSLGAVKCLDTYCRSAKDQKWQQYSMIGTMIDLYTGKMDPNEQLFRRTHQSKLFSVNNAFCVSVKSDHRRRSNALKFTNSFMP